MGCISSSRGSSRPRDEPTSPVSPALQILYAIVKLNNQRRQWHPTPALLPGESHRWRNLAGCSPWGHEELDMTEQLHFHFSLSCIGEGNGDPLQCSCLENPSDVGAWWAAVYGVTQSQTLLKRLSSSSSSSEKERQMTIKLRRQKCLLQLY